MGRAPGRTGPAPRSAEPARGHRRSSEGQLLTHVDHVRVLDGALVLLPELLPALAVGGGDLAERVAGADGVATPATAGAGRGGALRPVGVGGGRGAGRRRGDGLGGPAGEVLTADRPGADALAAQHLLGHRDLLRGAGQVGPGGVLAAAVGLPRRGAELQPAVVAVAGVDRPVATGLALGDPAPV